MIARPYERQRWPRTDSPENLRCQTPRATRRHVSRCALPMAPRSSRASREHSVNQEARMKGIVGLATLLVIAAVVPVSADTVSVQLGASSVDLPSNPSFVAVPGTDVYV